MSDSVTGMISTAREQLRKALARLRGGVEEPEPDDDPGDEQAEPDFSGDLQGLFMVGFTQAAPGGDAWVKVLGATNFETIGFSLAIGVDPSVKIIGHDTAPELEEMLGIDNPQQIVRQQDGPGNDWYTEFVQCGIIFYRTLGDVLSQDPSNPPQLRPKRTIVETVIPRWTPIYVLHFKVPDDATPGDRIDLTIDHTYGQRLRGGGPIKQIDWPNMYNTRRAVSRTGVYPPEERRVSGWIDVIEPIA